LSNVLDKGNDAKNVDTEDGDARDEPETLLVNKDDGNLANIDLGGLDP